MISVKNAAVWWIGAVLLATVAIAAIVRYISPFAPSKRTSNPIVDDIRPSSGNLRVLDGDLGTHHAERKLFPLLEQIGSPFDEATFQEEFGKALPIPLAPVSIAESSISFTGGRHSPFRIITVSTKEELVLAIDLTIDSTSPSVTNVKAKLLEGFTPRTSHSVSMLTPSLEEVECQWKELGAPSGTLSALTMASPVSERIILFDRNMAAPEMLLPSTKQLPPDLLERARALAKKRTEILEAIHE